MIIITGAAGFIASNLVEKLNSEGIVDLVLVDDFGVASKASNHEHAKCTLKIHRDEFLGWFELNSKNVNIVYHLGARTDTTEKSQEVLDILNLNYSKSIWKICAKNKIPLIYASSAATYGDGSLGYDDNHQVVEKLQPLNLYGKSKNDFDIWALQQKETPPHWYGLKFFNVFGPHEFHKGRMASVVLHAFYQIKETGSVSLFKSHHPDYKDGEQLRDFVYVKEIVNICLFLVKEMPASGIYNAGSGQAHTFNELVEAVFKGLQIETKVEYIPMPEDLRGKYQYFTEANMNKLQQVGYKKVFITFREAVLDYLIYLVKQRISTKY